MTRLRSLPLLILVSLCLLYFGDRVWVRVFAVTPCVNPDQLGKRDAWPAGTTVNVNISHFPNSLQPCVQTAFDNWNNANSTANGTKITFKTVFNDTPVTTGAGGGSQVYQVTYEQPAVNGTPENIPGVTADQTNSSGTNLVNAKTQINPNVTDCTQITQVTAHEIGHTEGLNDCTKCTQPKTSVMVGIPCAMSSGSICLSPDWNNTANGLPAPTTCDNSTVNQIYFPPPVQIPGCQTDCPSGSRTCIPCGASPVVLDLDGNGFNLTDAANGVRFDISGTGNPIQMGWTAAGSTNAFLALPGADGLVHNGQQLFGNFTPQPASDQPNGFAALAAYDDPSKGGNGDGIIDARDAVFSLLRLWIDANHDGISQPEELHTLPSLGVIAISLNYKRDDKTDDYGNAFRYRTRVNPEEHTDVGKKAYDIFFVVGTNPSVASNRCVVPAAIARVRGYLQKRLQEEGPGPRSVAGCYETSRGN
jgi:hypothetical protein